MEHLQNVDVVSLFQPTRSPKFVHRKGPTYELGNTCNKKLCFTSCDRELLAWHMYQLSLRQDCFFVKFGISDRGGMYLGRCFLNTASGVGEVWARYKDHPSLFCTIQDDDFTDAFRERCDELDGLWVSDYVTRDGEDVRTLSTP
jgi:hypothetical protein